MSSYDGTDRIGPFDVVRVLGDGGMGKVYLCRTRAGQRVAVKVIRRELADIHEIRARFNREVHALRDVHSPYTVPVYAAETITPPLWLATRYVAGPTLEARVVEQGPLTERQVAELGAMLAEALAEVHARGVIHRDVKPANIILESGEPRLIDFGIARTTKGTRGLTLPGTILGTHGYMAPEQLMGQEPTAAVDVFALGAVLAYAATGRPPFGTGQPASIRILQGAPPRLTGVPGALGALIAACLAPGRNDRPLPSQVLSVLGALLAPEPSADDTDATVPRQRTVPVPDPPHRCHVPAKPGAGDPCALRPFAARLLDTGLTRSLLRKAVLHDAR
ncbi:serine/threonine protein kinase [Streptomyces venezuelae]|uniref:serine/threonine-protein kinase n=1 Tax=Streptomyces venezuelae TaxID=54571 RepID=UPI0012384FB9|nr:serine/threonine-protein kinase [Streptomyces venezuelae]QES08572.1 serine/threonine protein kinase [Streptomyces venezuelae]